MGRQPCCDKVGLKKGPWTAEEDKKLINFMLTNGQCCWRALPKLAGLLRCGKSCRLRWTNYLRPDLKRGLLSESEEKLVIDLHAQLGNRWSKIASHLAGRTDNEIKNHWNTHIKKKLKKMGIDPMTHKPIAPTEAAIIPDVPKDQATPASSSATSPNQSPSPNTDQETKEEVDRTTILSTSNSFGTDEVPMIDPSEILVQPCSSSSACSTSSSSSSADSILQELDFPSMDWPGDNSNASLMSILEDDFNWEDLLIDPIIGDQASHDWAYDFLL